MPSREPPERFPVRFYLVAMIFIVFDIEIIFLYPYAVIHDELGVFGLVEMIVFAVLGVRLVRVPDRQRRPRLGPGQAAAPSADPQVSRAAHRRRRPSAGSASRAGERTEEEAA